MSSTKTAATIPAYLTLVARILELCEEMGQEPVRAGTASTLPENKNYVFVRFGSDDAAALIVPKAAGAVKLCDIHVDLSTEPGWVPLTKPNGRVLGRVDLSVADLSSVLIALVGASKRPVKRGGKASQAPASQADMDAFLAKLQQMGKAKAPASEPELPASEETFEEEGESVEA